MGSHILAYFIQAILEDQGKPIVIWWQDPLDVSTLNYSSIWQPLISSKMITPALLEMKFYSSGQNCSILRQNGVIFMLTT